MFFLAEDAAIHTSGYGYLCSSSCIIIITIINHIYLIDPFTMVLHGYSSQMKKKYPCTQEVNASYIRPPGDSHATAQDII